MLRTMTVLILAALLTVPTLVSAESKVNINVNLGVPVLPPPPPAPMPAAPHVVFSAPPLFLAPAGLGFYVGVDMPHDLMLVSGVYYLFQGNQWYRAGHYNGPWTVTRYEQLPTPLRKQKMETIREDRENEYRRYHQDRDHYRGKHFRPGQEKKGPHWKEEKRREKEERRQERDEWKHGRKHHRDDD